ncbi:chromosome segregation and condensation protein ScpA [Ameyamaea chiangmaiensis NBRC 103196]|uniref:segregation and condensation protein A n=1 Tax=Ameyamaea chiangmaiensis TaxID=442969 RepID=UPI001FE99F55|nr:ScpA family protein [Ameyamaea chiangmaiensis]GBQ70307.1 chromosome segregation and condensation protein ScpA [Ameyamaea chiangmaiensis NBRC 103196]
MAADAGAEEGVPPDGVPDDLPRSPLLHLDGFEGPLDLLLDLARAQKVDLARISILALVEQYLAVVESARRIRLELAADWLVMAAWLTWLKSRLLLPTEDGADLEAEEASELLAARLMELERMRLAARWLADRPRLGHEVFARGAAEDLRAIDRSGLKLDMGALMAAYMAAIRRTARKRTYAPRRLRFWTVQEALGRLRRLLGADMVPGEGGAGAWFSLDSIVPDVLPDVPKDDAEARRMRRAALAGTLIAGLEMAKGGELELRQEAQFGEILLRPQAARPTDDEEEATP